VVDHEHHVIQKKNISCWLLWLPRLLWLPCSLTTPTIGPGHFLQKHFKVIPLENISRNLKFDSFNFLEKIAFVFLTADSADFKHCCNHGYHQ